MVGETQFYPYPGALHFVEAIPQTRVTAAGATNGTALTLSEFEGNVAIGVHSLRATAGTTPTLNYTVEHRASASDSWGAVPAAALIDPDTGDADTFTQTTDAAGGGLEIVELVRARCKAQIRVVATVAGSSSPTFLFSAFIVGSDKYGDQ